MMNKHHNHTPFKRALLDVFFTWVNEFKAIFSNKGVMVLLILAPLAYPLLYSFIYKNEVIRDIPIAVVDESGTQLSRQYIRNIDATPEVYVAVRCTSKEEAQKLYENRVVHGIVIIPRNFQDKLYTNQQATIAAHTDMSSFLYYKALMGAVSYVSRDMGVKLQVSKLMAEGVSERQAVITAAPFTFSYTPLYNQSGGYASFLVPGVLILIIHQTLLIGIGMLSGSAYENNPKLYLNQIDNRRQSVFGVLLAKSMCYLVFYLVLSFYILCLIPHWFNLPHLGNPFRLFIFVLPFLLATIFFAMTLAVFMRTREMSMLLFLFLSIPLLFISGISWPVDGMPLFWKAVGWLFPSTHGIIGYVKLNSMGAKLSGISAQYISLWIQAGLYFITAYIVRIIQLRRLKRVHGITN